MAETDTIARLTRERDEARERAAKEAVIASSALSRATAAEAKAERLAKAAKKRLSEIPHHDEGSCRRIDCGDCALRAALAAEEGK